MVFRQGKDLSNLDLGKILGGKLLAKFRAWLGRQAMDAEEGIYYLIWHALAFYEDSKDDWEAPDRGIRKLKCPSCGENLICSVVLAAEVNCVLVNKKDLIFYYVVPPAQQKEVALKGLTCPGCGAEGDVEELAKALGEKLKKTLRLSALDIRGMSAEGLRLFLRQNQKKKEA